MKKGIFIAIEGIDGCGKSTFTNMLYSRLVSLGHAEKIEFFTTFDEDDWGRFVRNCIVNDNGLTQEHLAPMLSDLHTHNYNAYVQPGLNQGKIVFVDRSIYSTLVFQFRDTGIPMVFNAELFKKMLMGARNYLVPDSLIVVDTPAELARERLLARGDTDGDRVEAQPIEVHAQYRDAYIEYVNSEMSKNNMLFANIGSLEMLQQQANIAADQIIEIYNQK